MRNNSEDVVDSVGMSPTVADGTVDDDIITFGPHTSDLIGASDNESLPDSRTKARNSSFREALLQTNNLSGKYDGEEVMQLGGTIKDMNVLFPSSVAMELLTEYDDGISCKIIDESGTNECGEPVFCRICREGLHDVTFDPSSAQSSKNVSRREFHVVSRSSSEDEINQMNAQTMNISRLGQNGNRLVGHEGEEKAPVYGANNPQQHIDTKESSLMLGIQRHHPSVENPLLAPCECSGSMRFVHYLCIEQWRCRSRHPNARHGLSCETCGGFYLLPPPTSRPPLDSAAAAAAAMAIANGGDLIAGGIEGGDWLEAMPPHVLAALRRPHLFWQLGAAIVRRRYLRPLAPVLISPIVALYCRARRSLKKHGVSRRRWACSLCRRRARWKCVRCLRSYYCSRQCQNVSWHIVHKHVCYKPARFWWSVVVYSVVIMCSFPGIWDYPHIYALGLFLVPRCFYVQGVIAGGFASGLRKTARIDIRGRALEIFVVLCTVAMSTLSLGLVWGFFGKSEKCISSSLIQSPNFTSQGVNSVLSKSQIFITKYYLSPIGKLLKTIDQTFVHKLPKFVQTRVCSVRTQDENGPSLCFESLDGIDPEFLLHGSCGNDFLLLIPFLVLCLLTQFTWFLFKKRGGGGDRQHRANRHVNDRGVRRDAEIEHLHQD